ncbi:urea carboxylase-associated family protein [Haloplanus rallus]|jgi:uncharacterized protein YcgI (DUF1989 family)|uniref:Urea carboxylase-associated family protein n=1 Tax=Haloplanus rallus TaxID=1816183 RepID=A0A6B9F4E6_9EURY|nr:urea carboxylase-associated family protein [Haloplanus rallus]QGX94212.1 urea carboxylase-associated family protein [Haloplanus rallus]
MQERRIPEKRGAAFEVAAGETFDVTDVEGQQVADLVAFAAEDPTERFSTKYTYRRSGRISVTEGDTLYTTEGEPILSITADDCGDHDLLYGPCNEWILADYYGQSGGNGCRENLAEAVEPLGVDPALVLETLNVFMRAEISDGHIDIQEPQSTPGDTVRFRAERDCYVAVSACAGESTVNAGETGPIDVAVPDGTDLHTNW